MLLDAIKAGTDNRRTLKWPGTDEDVTLRILSSGEHQAAVVAAQARFKELRAEMDTATVEAFEDEKDLQILFRALRDAEDKPVAKNVDLFRQTVTRQEIQLLAEEYVGFEREVSPRFDTLDEKDFNELFEGLKKKPEAIGNVSSTALLRRLFIASVSRLPS